MRQRREQMGLSRGDLAREIGVSSRMVDQYEADEAEVTVMRGIRIMELLGEDIFTSYNPFDIPPFPLLPQDVELSEISVKYSKLGFEVSEFKKVPFDIIARQDKELIVTEVGDVVNPDMSPISRLLDAENLVIFEEQAPKDADVPSMRKEDFLEIRKSKELVKFLRDF